MNRITWELFSKAKIKKSYTKVNVEYVQLSYYDEDSNKVVTFEMTYKRYLLQQYLRYIIPSEYNVIHLDNNPKNFDIYNLVIRDSVGESPVYKEFSIKPHGKKSEYLVLQRNKEYGIKKQSSVETEILLGRKKIMGERLVTKEESMGIKRKSLYSELYPKHIITGPHRNVKNWYVYIKNVITKKRFKIAYAKFLYQEHLGRVLTEDEYVILKINDNFDLSNMLLKKINYYESNLYEKYLSIRGPYFESGSDRLTIQIYYAKGSISSVSYPKFLMQEHLGRLLTKDETVHHKDGDYYNNELTNLEILSRREHIRFDTLRIKEPVIVCQVCGTEFILKKMSRYNFYRRSKQRNTNVGPFCSRGCDNIGHLYKHLYKNALPEKEYYNFSKTYT